MVPIGNDPVVCGIDSVGIGGGLEGDWRAIGGGLEAACLIGGTRLPPPTRRFKLVLSLYLCVCAAARERRDALVHRTSSWASREAGQGCYVAVFQWPCWPVADSGR